MGIRTFRPITPSRRHMSMSDFADLTQRNNPERSLIEPLHSSGGRNNHGRTTVRFRGGGHKRRYRVIDFRRNKIGVPAKVATIEYDPNRTARIALLHYLDGEKRYIIAPVGLTVGMMIESSDVADILPGNSLPLGRIPLGTQVHAIELKPGKGAQLARSAGTSAQIVAREGNYVSLRLPSGEIRKVLAACRATVGQVGNAEHENMNLGKAGRSRWLGRRPHVRGTAMNPVDHPLGGGEGRNAGGRHPVSPWGQPTRGYKTRRRKDTSKYIVKRRKQR